MPCSVELPANKDLWRTKDTEDVLGSTEAANAFYHAHSKLAIINSKRTRQCWITAVGLRKLITTPLCVIEGRLAR